MHSRNKFIIAMLRYNVIFDKDPPCSVPNTFAVFSLLHLRLLVARIGQMATRRTLGENDRWVEEEWDRIRTGSVAGMDR